MPKKKWKAAGHIYDEKFPSVAGGTAMDHAFRQLSKILFEIAHANSGRQEDTPMEHNERGDTHE